MPELPEGWKRSELYPDSWERLMFHEVIDLDDLRALLATQGLTVVTEAEAACAKHGLAWLRSPPDELGKREGMMVLALRRYEAELARCRPEGEG